MATRKNHQTAITVPKKGVSPRSIANLTGGSRKGVPNKATAKREKAIAASGLTPLDYMLSVLRDEGNTLEVRIDAAKSAAPYCHPKLATITHNGPDGGPVVFSLTREDEAL